VERVCAITIQSADHRPRISIARSKDEQSRLNDSSTAELSDAFPRITARLSRAREKEGRLFPFCFSDGNKSSIIDRERNILSAFRCNAALGQRKSARESYDYD